MYLLYTQAEVEEKGQEVKNKQAQAQKAEEESKRIEQQLKEMAVGLHVYKIL